MVTRIVKICGTGVHLSLFFRCRPCQLLWHPTGPGLLLLLASWLFAAPGTDALPTARVVSGEFPVSVRNSEKIALCDPVMPVTDSFRG